MIPAMIAGETTTDATVERVRDDLLWRNFLPGLNEFGGPFTCLTLITSEPSPQRSGMTYAESMLWVLPTLIYPGIKPASLASEFAESLHTEFFPNLEYRIGWGFSPVVEAYVNFGFFGIPFVCAVFAILWRATRNWPYRNLTGMLTYLLVLPAGGKT